VHHLRASQIALAVLITLYGGLLRFEALAVGYGGVRQPEWGKKLERTLVPIARALRPRSIVWHPAPQPYVGGDPVNYIRYAREMRHFYQAHVREPMFLASTRTFLWLTGGRDIAVSYASALAGTLAIFATFLLGAAAFSPSVGLGAAFALAIEHAAITWSADGWRDDTFMLFVTLSAWSLVRLQQQPTTNRGIVAGLMTGAACLTRISAISFVVPALIWMWFFPRQRRADVRPPLIVATVVAVGLVAPYLFNCWSEFGDPLYALNYHTRYYRHADGLPLDESVGAIEYAVSKLAARPIATLDTAAQGLVTVPFVNKWTGWQHWSAGIEPVLKVFGGLGMVVALWSPHGRLLILIVFSSLVPYALTWSLGGGGEWRFTQHVYPIYLIVAFAAMAILIEVICAVVIERKRISISRPLMARVAVLVAVVAVMVTAHGCLPWLTAREALGAGDAVSITAGERDGWFFEGRWSAPIDYGNVAVRVAQAPLVGIRLPLADSAYVLTLRMDPALTADPTRQPNVTVFLNRHQLAELSLVRDPTRMGSYRMQVPREIVKPLSRLDILASHTVPAEEGGTPFESLPRDAPVAFRLWYVRLEPLK
jgi:hypothetical protein